MKRILLFLATNIAVLLIASITLSLLGFEGFLAANGVDLDLRALLIFCAIFGMGGSVVSLAMSKWIAKRATGCHVIEQPSTESERWLVNTVGELAQAAGIRRPEVGVFHSPQPNAFATGWNRNDSLVAVSTGLLESMRPDEIKAVLGHEIGHAANGDMVTLALIQGVVNVFVLFFARVIGHTVDRVVFRTEQGYGIGYFVGTIVAQLVLSILASIIVMWFSRQREFRADAAGARLAGRQNMIGALERLRGTRELPSAMPDSMTAFGINPTGRRRFGQLFASHPPLDERIEALRRAA
jgi:heat shock protein HtpX